MGILIYYIVVFFSAIMVSGGLFSAGVLVYSKTHRKNFFVIFDKVKPFTMASGVALGLLYLFIK